MLLAGSLSDPSHGRASIWRLIILGDSFLEGEDRGSYTLSLRIPSAAVPGVILR